MDAFLTYLLDKAPALACVLILCVMVWRAAKQHQQTENRVSSTEKAIKEIGQAILSLRSDITDIQFFITSKFPTAVNTFAAKKSPLHLNEYGQQVLEACGGMAFLQANQALFIGLIEAKKPQTALDVEMAAKEVLLSQISNSIFNQIKLWVYKSPAMKIGDKDYTVSLGDVCFILSLPLRDKYLALHPEVAQ